MRFLLCATDVFSKYALAVPLKDKKGIAVTNNFQKIFDESDHKPNKICLIKVLNFKIDQWNHGCRIMVEKHIQHITKENLLLLKDLLEP